MNVFTFTGNLGRDCTTNNVNGTAVANFAVGVKSGWGDKEQTVWMDCALWGKQAESGLIQYLVKGQRVSVSGELGTREYDANDGSTKTAITCRVSSVDLEGSAGGNQPQQQQSPQQRQQQPQRQPAPQQQQQRQSPTQGDSRNQPQQQPGYDVPFDDSIPF